MTVSDADFEELQTRFNGLKHQFDVLLINLLQPALDVPGTLRYGGNVMQLDQKGIQVVTTSDLAAMYFLPAFKVEPASYYPRAQVSGFSTGTFAASYLSAYGSASQYAKVQAYTGITNAKPEVIIQTQTTGGILAQIDMSSTDAGSDAATIAVTGEIASAVTAQTQITGSQNDYDVGARLRTAVSISSDAAYDITGIDATNVLNGGLLFIQNAGGFAITLKDESGSSSAANRFALSGDIVLNPDDGCVLQYNTTASRWRCLGKSSGGGIATDTIWAAAGDLAVGTGADTAQRLAVGADGQVLFADSSATTGLKWKNIIGNGLNTNGGAVALDYTYGHVRAASLSSNSTITLPQFTGAAAELSKMIVIQRNDTSSYSCTVSPYSGQTINGSSSARTLGPYESLTFVSPPSASGTDWGIV